jgi:hypothetical protein
MSDGYSILILVVLGILFLALVGFVNVLVWLSKQISSETPRDRDISTAQRVLRGLVDENKLPEETFDGIVRALREKKASPPFELPSQLTPGNLVVRPPPTRPTKTVETERDEITFLDVPEVAREPRPEAVTEVSAPPEPRRSWREVFALFLEQKNIRWGEIASGILIVGSAVGLVLSLREQLIRVIPYFPALLFLMITAAIIGAGVYTLRRWRLQMTSRGILIIGLLLVPLNVLMGCWLAGVDPLRRGATDALYWIAMAIQIASLAALSLVAAKNLLRVRYGGLAASLIGTSAFMLVLNRIPDPTASMLLLAVWLLPFACFFGIAVAGTGPNMEKRNWSTRSFRRLLTQAAIAIFALGVAMALYFIRWPGAKSAFAIAPTVVFTGAVLQWLGLLVRERLRANRPAWQTTATALVSLGLILAVGAALSATAHLSLGMATLVLVAILWGLIAWRTQIGWTVPAAMGAFAACVLHGTTVGSEIISGRWHWEQFLSIGGWLDSLISARSGISLFAGAAAMVPLAHRFGDKTKDGAEPHSVARWATIAGIAGTGALLALISSLVHPEREFDMSMASWFLAVSAIVSWILSVARANTRSMAWIPALTHALMIVALVHSCWWNVPVRQWLDGMGGKNTWFPIAAALYALASATGFAVMSSRRPRDVVALFRQEAAQWFAIGAITGSLIVWAWAISLIPREGTTATVLAATSAFVWLLLAIWSNAHFRSGFALALGMLLLIAVSAYGRQLGLFPAFSHARFVLWLLAALLAWSLPWVWLRHWSQWGRGPAFLDTGNFQPERIISDATIMVVCGLIAAGLWPLVCAEIATHARVAALEWVSLAELRWFYAILLVLGAASLLTGCLDRAVKGALFSFGAMVLAGAGLASLVWMPQVGVASGLRFTISAAGLLFSLLVAGAKRLYFDSSATSGSGQSAGIDSASRMTSRENRMSIGILLGMGIFVVMAITGVVTWANLVEGGKGIGGPVKPSWIGDLPKDISYGVPIALLVATCLSWAISQHRTGLAMLGSGVFQCCVAGSLYLLAVSNVPAVASERFAQILQWVSIGMSLYGVVWFWQRERIEPARISRSRGSLLPLHVITNLVLVLALCAAILGQFWWRGHLAGDWARAIGGPLGILSVLLLVPLSLAVLGRGDRTRSIWLAGVPGVSGVSILAIHLDRMWASGLACVAWGLTGVVVVQVAIGWRSAVRSSGEKFVSSWKPTMDDAGLAVTAGLALLFAERLMTGNFWSGWSTVIVLAGLALILSLRYFSSWSLLCSHGLAVLAAVSIWRYQKLVLPDLTWRNGHLLSLMQIAAAAISLVAVAWALFQGKRKQRREPRGFADLTNVTSVAGAIGISMIAVQVLALGNTATLSDTFIPLDGLRLLAMIMATGLVVLQVWRARSGGSVIAAACCSLAWVAAAVMATAWRTGPMATAAYGALAAVWGWLYWQRNEVAWLLKQAGSPRPARIRSEIKKHLPLLTGLLAFGVLGLIQRGYTSHQEVGWKLLTALSVLPLSIAFFFLAGRPTNRALQPVTVCLAVLAGLLVSWAWLDRGDWPVVYLERAIVVLSLAVAMCTVVLPGLIGQFSEWRESFRGSTITGTVIVGVILVQLWLLYGEAGPEAGEALSASIESVVALVAVALLAGSLIMAAIVSQRGPERNEMAVRKGFVYAAQVVVVLGILYGVRAVPWLFRLGLEDYWPCLVMLFSFGGILFSRVLERRKLEVLAEPLLNTSMVVPLIGAAGAILSATRVDASWVMVLAGMVYLMLSYTHSSPLAGLTALLFGNFALYCFYERFDEYHFAAHPQLWLVPPAISALIAAQLHRKKLDRGQLAAIRYGALGVIYASSMSEIYIAGVGETIWPPIILAILALAGMGLGILIQIRSFLFVGVVFLLVAVVAMISHAHRRLEHVWPWWAFGILTGIAILAVFGIFEKRRNDLHRLATRLQQWDV